MIGKPFASSLNDEWWWRWNKETLLCTSESDLSRERKCNSDSNEWFYITKLSTPLQSLDTLYLYNIWLNSFFLLIFYSNHLRIQLVRMDNSTFGKRCKHAFFVWNTNQIYLFVISTVVTKFIDFFLNKNRMLNFKI